MGRRVAAPPAAQGRDPATDRGERHEPPDDVPPPHEDHRSHRAVDERDRRVDDDEQEVAQQQRDAGRELEGERGHAEHPGEDADRPARAGHPGAAGPGLGHGPTVGPRDARREGPGREITRPRATARSAVPYRIGGPDRRSRPAPPISSRAADLARRAQRRSPRAKPSAVTRSQIGPTKPAMYCSGDTPVRSASPPSTNPTTPSQRGAAACRSAATPSATPRRPPRPTATGSSRPSRCRTRPTRGRRAPCRRGRTGTACRGPSRAARRRRRARAPARDRREDRPGRGLPVEPALEPGGEDEHEQRARDRRGVEHDLRARAAGEVGDDRLRVAGGLLPADAERHRGLDGDQAEDAGDDPGPGPRGASCRGRGRACRRRPPTAW